MKINSPFETRICCSIFTYMKADNFIMHWMKNLEPTIKL